MVSTTVTITSPITVVIYHTNGNHINMQYRRVSNHDDNAIVIDHDHDHIQSTIGDVNVNDHVTHYVGTVDTIEGFASNRGWRTRRLSSNVNILEHDSVSRNYKNSDDRNVNTVNEIYTNDVIQNTMKAQTRPSHLTEQQHYQLLQREPHQSCSTNGPLTDGDTASYESRSSTARASQRSKP